MLDGVLRGNYTRWCRTPRAIRLVTGSGKHVLRTIQHKIERERFWKAIGGRGYRAATSHRL